MIQRVLSFADQTISLIYPPEIQEVVDFVFADCQGGNAGQETGEVTVAHGITTDTYILSYDGDQEDVEVKTEDLGQQLLIYATNALIRELRAGLAIHAGAVSLKGKAVLIPGMGGAGKSMLAAWFLGRSFQYLTDELICITGDDLELLALKRPLSIKKPGRPLLDHVFQQAAPPWRIMEGTSADLIPWRAFPTPVLSTEKTVPALLIFPEFRPRAEISIEGLSPAQAGLLLLACLVNARNLKHHGFPQVSQVCRKIPALRLIYGDWQQLPGVLDRLVTISMDYDLGPSELAKLTAPFNRCRYQDEMALQKNHGRHEAIKDTFHRKSFPVPSATPSGPAKKLTIGMATYDDYDGVYFSIQSLRLYHPEILDVSEILVVDNHPDGLCSEALKKLENSILGYRYVPQQEVTGTAVRDVIFREAAGEYVLCMDCHVLIVPGALQKLLEYFEHNPDQPDLLQGPLVNDDLVKISTHFDPVWRHGMYGIWATDDRGRDVAAAAFEIPMQGLGLFCCRKDAWPGFNPRFRGFGGEEGYIHEKFRRNGGRTLCLPFLRWLHRFDRPMGIPYSINWEDRIYNYTVGFQELGLDRSPIAGHFSEHLEEETARQLVAQAEKEVSSPLFYFDALYCLEGERKPFQQEIRTGLLALASEKRLRTFRITAAGDALYCRVLAHRTIVASAQRQGLSHVVIAEEYAVFSGESWEQMSRTMAELRDVPWAAFLFGGAGSDFAVVQKMPCLSRPFSPALSPVIAYHRCIFAHVLANIPEDEGLLKEWFERHGSLESFLMKFPLSFAASLPLVN